MNKPAPQPLSDKFDLSGKYIYLAIAAYWLAGIIVAGYVLVLPHGIELRFDLFRALLVSYLFGISLLVSHNYCRNFGPSLLFSILLPCVPLAVGVPSLFPLFAFGLTGVAWLRRSNIRDSVGHIGMAEIAALIVTASVFAAIALTATQAAGAFFVSDVHHEFLNLDALYHSAITAMIKNYGVSSIGLNGLVERHYHIFSHIVFAAMSFGTGLSAMSSFGILQFVLIEPLLLLAIVATAETIRPSSTARSFFIRIAFLFIAFQMIVAWPMFGQFALSDSYFSSQSYALSLILMLATICAMQMKQGNHKYITLIALVLLTAASKISTGAVCFAMVSIHLAWFDPSSLIKRIATWAAMAMGFSTLLFLTSSGWWLTILTSLFDRFDIRRIVEYGLIPAIAISGIVASLIFLSRQSILTPPAWLKSNRLPLYVAGIVIGILGIFLLIWGDSIVFDIGTFMRIYGGVPTNARFHGFWLALGKFALVHFCFTWLLIVLAGIMYLTDKRKAEYLTAPLLYSIAALAISWAVLLLTNLGSAEFYFTNVAMFIALPYLLTIFSERISDGIWTSIAGGVLAVLIATLLWTLKSGQIKCDSRNSVANLLQRMNCNIPKEKYNNIVRYLDEIRQDTSTSKLGVYVAREESEFFDAKSSNCLQRPFVIPAVSERPGLLSLPDLVCNPTHSGYGFNDYKDEEYVMSGLPRASHETLMKIAEKAGLEGYVDVTKNGWTIYRRDKQNYTATEPSNNLMAR